MSAPAPTTHQIPTTARTALFLGEREPLVAEITQTWSTDGTEPDWTDRVLAELAPHERVIASVAFRRNGPVVAHRLAPHLPGPRMVPAQPEQRRHGITQVIDEARYAGMVRDAVERIESTALQKVVLGRVIDVISDPPLRADEVIRHMLDTRPGRFIFVVPLAEGAAAPLILGASPELLVRRQGLHLTSVPLAGSIPRSTDPQADRERADALLESAKDLAEHAFVVDGITERLAGSCAELRAASRPELLATDTMWHLATPIHARLRESHAALSALHLARMLQPTPAVGGCPADLAEHTIDELEGDLRGHLAGAVGWVDGNGDGEFALAIRSGVLAANRLRLFAGAGIVHDSDPASETREVAAKLETMMKAVGL